MERIKFIDHRSKNILLLDFSYCKSEEVLALIDTARQVLTMQPFDSVLTLTDVTETKFNETVVNAMKNFAKSNKPYVRASAVVGVTGLKRIVFDAVVKFTGRNMSLHDNRESALSWLASR